MDGFGLRPLIRKDAGRAGLNLFPGIYICPCVNAAFLSGAFVAMVQSLPKESRHMGGKDCFLEEYRQYLDIYECNFEKRKRNQYGKNKRNT